MMAKDLSSNVTIVGFPGSRDRKVSPNVERWLKEKRRISGATLAKLPVASGITFFPELERKTEAVFFQYPGGWKARSIEDKDFVCKPGTKTTFWNLEAVLAGKMKEVYITEGELDACTMVECGIPADEILAAPAATKGDHEYVRKALEAGLSKAKKIVWCGDQDEAGLELRTEMVKLLGVAKFHFIEWPMSDRTAGAECKDANEYLISHGPEAVLDLVRNGALQWPVEGLFDIEQIPESAPLTCWNPWDLTWIAEGKEQRFPEKWPKRMQLAAGTLSVVTGHPGMGKTLLFGQIWYSIVRKYDLIACVASFETRPKPHVRRQLRTLHQGKLEIALNDEEISTADAWIKQHYLFAVHPERRADLGWLLDKAEIAVVRNGARILQIDPWNRLEASRESRESETDYIGRCLREMYNFATDFNCHVQVVAHPSKVEGIRRGKPPDLEDIHGSKHWDNMADQGSVVHRPKLFNEKGERLTEAVLYHKKARFEELGYASKMKLRYHVGHGRFIPDEQNVSPDDVPPLELGEE